MAAALLLMGMVFAWGLIRFRRLDIKSMEREAVIEGVRDGMIVLDTQNRIVELNLAARRILNCSASSSSVGQPISP